MRGRAAAHGAKARIVQGEKPRYTRCASGALSLIGFTGLVGACVLRSSALGASSHPPPLQRTELDLPLKNRVPLIELETMRKINVTRHLLTTRIHVAKENNR